MEKRYQTLLFLTFITLLTGLSSAQPSQQCLVIETEGEINFDENQVLEAGEVIHETTVVSSSDDSSAVVNCGQDFGPERIPEEVEGEVSDVTVPVDDDYSPSVQDLRELEDAVEEEAGTNVSREDIPEDADLGLENVLNQTEEIERMAEEEINPATDELAEELPMRTVSFLTDNRINIQVDNTTLGTEFKSLNITKVESGGIEDPTLDIETEEEVILEIMESEDPINAFREKYHGEGIDIEANSVGNRIKLAVANVASRIYGSLEE